MYCIVRGVVFLLIVPTLFYPPAAAAAAVRPSASPILTLRMYHDAANL